MIEKLPDEMDDRASFGIQTGWPMFAFGRLSRPVAWGESRCRIVVNNPD
jgi:hypothetical protein